MLTHPFSSKLQTEGWEPPGPQGSLSFLRQAPAGRAGESKGECNPGTQESVNIVRIERCGISLHQACFSLPLHNTICFSPFLSDAFPTCPVSECSLPLPHIPFSPGPFPVKFSSCCHNLAHLGSFLLQHAIPKAAVSLGFIVCPSLLYPPHTSIPCLPQIKPYHYTYSIWRLPTPKP